VDIRLDVISGVESAMREGMSEDNDRCFSTLVLGAFLTGVFQHDDDDDDDAF
jgi:hypothetical protein